jgi:hypothetical protein
MKKAILTLAVLCSIGLMTACRQNANNNTQDNMNQQLTLTQDWDKTFPQSEKVNHKKVTFKNRYGIMLAADLYDDKNGCIPYDKLEQFFKDNLK